MAPTADQDRLGSRRVPEVRSRSSQNGPDRGFGIGFVEVGHRVVAVESSGEVNLGTCPADENNQDEISKAENPRLVATR